VQRTLMSSGLREPVVIYSDTIETAQAAARTT
jgi:hypothetical protein